VFARVVTLVLYVLIMAAEQQLFATLQQTWMLQLMLMLVLLILVPVQDMVNVFDLTSASAHKDGQETHAKQR
jgi:fatty acid desaturase